LEVWERENHQKRDCPGDEKKRGRLLKQVQRIKEVEGDRTMKQ